MNRSRILAIIRRAFHYVEAGLWAALLAYVISFVAFVIPKVPEAAARAERLRAQEIAAEDKFYCERWGMMEGTHKHTLCTLDLQDFREKIEKRFADQMDF